MHIIHLRHAVAGLALLACTAAPLAAQAHETTPGQLHVTVEGTASAAPDLATLSAGVVAQAATASDAMAQQRERMSRVMQAIRAADIAEKDVQTSSFNLSPLYSRNETRNQPPRISGYQASNRVTVIVRDLTNVGAGLDALVDAGANNIGQVSFGFSNQAELVEQARTAAMAELGKRRDLFIETGGLKLGRLISLSEGGGHRPPQPMMMMDRAESAKASTPIAAGESTVSVTFSAVYEIVD